MERSCRYARRVATVIAFDPIVFFIDRMDNYELLCKNEGVGFIGYIEDERDGINEICADPHRLTQVFDNLMFNSLRFVDKGTIHFEVKLSDQLLIVKLTDDGPGFPVGQEKKLFNAFFQSSRKKGHAGLGLYIAKTIINNHDGLISAENMDKGGAIVTVSLPIRLRHGNKESDNYGAHYNSTRHSLNSESYDNMTFILIYG